MSGLTAFVPACIYVLVVWPSLGFAVIVSPVCAYMYQQRPTEDRSPLVDSTRTYLAQWGVAYSHYTIIQDSNIS